MSADFLQSSSWPAMVPIRIAGHAVVLPCILAIETAILQTPLAPAEGNNEPAAIPRETFHHGSIPAGEVDPALPNVLLLGDSISLGYAPLVAKKLAGKANVFRIKGSEQATVKIVGGLRLDTVAAREHLSDWLGDRKWAVIHFNWGLHDLKLDDRDACQVLLADYQKNIHLLIQRLKTANAVLIWASTTPIPPGVDRRGGGIRRRPESEIPYNAAAKKIMEENKIDIDDLHALVAPRLKELQRPGNVHFLQEGNEVLSDQAAGLIETALKISHQIPAQ
jgi:acyl-CoA thioesterase-1